jgi:small GTP-binding protein
MRASKPIQRKVILAGAFASGKTALVRCLAGQPFMETYEATASVTITKKEIILPSEDPRPEVRVNLALWDLGDLALTNKGSAAFFAGAHAVVWVLDLSRPVSWIGIGQQMAAWTEQLPAVPLLLVGSKADLVEGDTVQEQLQRAQLTPETWTSARTGQGVDALFQEVARLVLQ